MSSDAAKPQSDAAHLSRAERRAGALSAVREKVAITLAGFLLTGVFGTMVTTWIQQRGWAWQNRVAKIEKDTQNVLSTYRAAAELVNARWLASFEMARAAEIEKPGGERSAGWRAASEAFRLSDRDWALKFTNVAREIEFYVDTPFAVAPPTHLEAVYRADCASDPYAGFGGALDPRSARLALEIVNHCQAIVRDGLAPAIAAIESGAPLGAERTEATSAAFRRLDVVYKVNERLRCLIFERALAARGQLSNESYWGTFFGVESPDYSLPTAGRPCAS
jgi:hypothetical protein